MMITQVPGTINLVLEYLESCWLVPKTERGTVVCQSLHGRKLVVLLLRIRTPVPL
jgi:hypothetical protein